MGKAAGDAVPEEDSRPPGGCLLGARQSQLPFKFASPQCFRLCTCMYVFRETTLKPESVATYGCDQSNSLASAEI